jgi:hypothetical protein
MTKQPPTAEQALAEFRRVLDEQVRPAAAALDDPPSERVIDKTLRRLVEDVRMLFGEDYSTVRDNPPAEVVRNPIVDKLRAFEAKLRDGEPSE